MSEARGEDEEYTDRRARDGRRGPSRHRALGAVRAGRDGSRAQPADAAQAESRRRVRLPELRLARPGSEHRKIAEFCENGAKAVAWEATRKRVDAAFFAAHSVASLREQDDHWLERNGRLTEPMYLAPGAAHYAPIGWDDALRAGRRPAARAGGPEPGGVLHQRPGQQRGGVRLPAAGPAVGHQQPARLLEHVPRVQRRRADATIGVGKGTVTLDDIEEHADLIVIAGQNPGTNHPRMLTALEEAKRRGARIVAINPLPEAGLLRFTQPADCPRARRARHPARRPAAAGARQRRPGPVRRAEQGAARARGRPPGEVFDHDFIDRYCDGFEAAVAALAGARLGRRSSSTAGCPAPQIEELAATWSRRTA